MGYDVTAKDSGGKGDDLLAVVEKGFKNPKIIEGTAIKFGRSSKDAEEFLVKRFGKDTSGVVAIQWAKGGGHAFNWTIKEGAASFFDGQGGIESMDRYFRAMDLKGYLKVARLDNAEIDFEKIKKYVE